MTDLGAWRSFYAIVGSASGTLIGLQFVVMTLVGDRPLVGGEVLGSTFATPTIVHFSVVLLLSALASAPWDGIVTAALLWGAVGVLGLLYMLVVVRRMQTQTGYTPVLEDWVFHAVLPLVAYATLTVSAVAASAHVAASLVGLAAGALLLLFVGVHNAWDAVAYRVFTAKR